MQVINIQTERSPALFALDDPPDGVSVRVIGDSARDFGAELIVNAIIEIKSGIIISLVSAWIYEKLKNKPIKKITINRKETRLDKGEITRIIEESISIEDEE